MNRYWISVDTGKTWKQVDEQFWIEMEQACGFYGGKPATAGFTAGAVVGHMHYGWETDLCDQGIHD